MPRELSKDPFETIWPGIILAQAIYAASELQIADVLANTAMHVDKLADAIGARPEYLTRLLRALSNYDIFEFLYDGKVGNTDLSARLFTNRPDSRRPVTQFLAAPFIWRALGEMTHTVKTGETAFDRVFGQGFFSYLATHPEAGLAFNTMMTQGAAWTIHALLEAYEFQHFKKLVDVGGGEGAVLRDILISTPKLHGVLFDQPQVIANHVIDDDLMGRCEVAGGDYFDALPEGADVYLVNNVLHNWEDQEAVAILRTVRRSIVHEGTLLIIENLYEKTAGDVGVSDLLMMTIGGRERSEEAYKKLIEEAGFELFRTVPLDGVSLIECRPV